MTKENLEFGTYACFRTQIQKEMPKVLPELDGTRRRLPLCNSNHARTRPSPSQALITSSQCGTSQLRWMSLKQWLKRILKYHHSLCSCIKDKLTWKKLDSIHNSTHLLCQLPKTLSMYSDLTLNQMRMKITKNQPKTSKWLKNKRTILPQKKILKSNQSPKKDQMLRWTRMCGLIRNQTKSKRRNVWSEPHAKSIKIDAPILRRK